MKNIIKYYYNLDVDIVRQINDSYYLIINDNNYLLSPVNIEDLNKIKKYVDNPFFHKIITTINNYDYIIVNNINYILLKINTISKKIDINDIFNFSYFVSYSNDVIKKWINQWEEHIDYLEYQLSNSKFHKIEQIFNYYKGLAENAVQFLNTIEINNINVFLSHKRLKNDTNLIDLYNPVNIIIDSRVRDLSEYIKSIFFNQDNELLNINEEIRKILNLYTNDEKRLFFARLLYPSYFFDLCDNILINKYSENALNNVTSKSIQYEKFLVYIKNEIKKTTYIQNIDWLD